MDTASFFQKVLPAGGLKILAELVPFKDKKTGATRDGWRYTTYHSAETMAEAVEQFGRQKRTIYHACHAYGDWYMDEAKNKKRLRTAINVVACRSLYDDIDIGKEGCYQTRKEAMDAVRAVVKAGALPTPLVVYSGGGIHLYWPLTHDITPEQWLRLAAAKRQITSHYGLKVDRAVDMDVARVLRPVGTRNHKYEDSPEVVAKNDVSPYDPTTLQERMDAFIADNAMEPAPLPRKTVANAFGNLLRGDFEPSFADIVAKHCAQIRWFKETGAPDEPVWHKCLGLVKFCVDGESIVHEWSSQYSDYDAAETQTKLDAWEYDPTTCATFRSVAGERCEGCTQKCKSPIALGHAVREGEAAKIDVSETPPPETPAPQVTLTREEVIAKCKPSRYYEDDDHRLCTTVEVDGVNRKAVVSYNAFWITGWVAQPDKTWDIGVSYRARHGAVRKFTIPAACLSSIDKFVGALAMYGVFLAGTKMGGFALQYAKEFLDNLQYMGAEVDTVDAFGWDDKYESFVIGCQRYTTGGIKEVHLTDAVMSSGMGTEFGVSGSKERWVELVDKLYNRPGAEAYQFLFLVAASAPLVKIAGIDGFHGIPVALTGESGLGKTATCRMACGIWGKGSTFLHDSSTSGTTQMAMIKRMAIMRHLPRIFDEMTGQKTELLRDQLFALSNGQDKDRLKADGTFATGGMTWDTPSFITGNFDFTGMLNNLDMQQKDAAMVRVFEIKLPADYNERLWAGELAEVKNTIDGELQDIYGHGSAELIPFYIEKRSKIREHIFKFRGKFSIDDRSQIRERFYYDLLAVAMVAGHVMRKLGFIRFDLNNVERWAVDNIKTLRAARAAVSMTDEEYISQFLSWLQGRMLVTKSIPNIRSGESYELPLELPKNGPAMARLAVGDRRLIVSVKGLSEWCKEFGGASANTVRDWMDKHGYVLHVQGREANGAFGFRLGQGTHVPTGVARCLELNYSKVYDQLGDAAKNVVPMVSMASSIKPVSSQKSETA